MGFRRIISFITAAVISIGTLTAPVTVSAEETADTGQIVNETEVQGGNALSDMILDTADDEGEADSNPNSVSKVVIEDGKAVVSYHTEVGCDLVVAFYSDDGKRMYSSVSAAVRPVYDEGAEYEQTCTLDMPENVPEYFLVKAYLIGLGYAPISKEYSTNYYTESITEVRNAKPDDYDQELVVRLDEESDNSFLVLQDDTVAIDYDGIHNIMDVEKSDGNIYCFTNADEQLTSLKKGDVVYYGLPDEILAFTVKSITVSGTDVRIVAADDMKLSDAFSVYRIQETMQGTPDAEIGETYGEGVTYLGPETNETPAAIDPYSGRVLSKAESEPYEIPIAYNFTWKNGSLKANNENQETDDQEKKDQLDRSKYLGNGYGNGKFYGKVNGFVDLKIKVSGTLSIEVFGSDCGQDYSSLKTDITSELSGGMGFEADGKLILVGMTYSKSKFVALVGVGLQFKGKLEVNFSNISITDKREAILYRDGISPQSLFVNHILDANLTDPELKIRAEGFIGLYAGVEAYILSGSDKIGFELEGYGGIKAKSTIISTHNDDNSLSRHTCANCHQGTLYFSADLKVSAGLGEILGGKLKLSTSASEILKHDPDCKITDYYYSATYGDFGLKKCPHQDYRIDIYVTENGDPVQGAEVIVTDGDNKTQTLSTNEDGVIKEYWPDGTYKIQCKLDDDDETTSIPHYGRRNTVEFKYTKFQEKYYRDHTKQDDDDNEIKVKKVAVTYSPFIITEDDSLYIVNQNVTGYPLKFKDNVESVSVFDNNIAIISKDGGLYIQGAFTGSEGESIHYFEYDDNTGYEVPALVMNNVASVELGYCNVAAITKDGSLYTWGYNEHGQLGNGSKENCSTPTKIMDNVASVSLGWGHGAAITKDGSLYTWGNNEQGQLGNGTYEESLVPIKIRENMTSVSLGKNTSAAIDKYGNLYTWGDNRLSQLGIDGFSGHDYPTPFKILGNVVSVSMDEYSGGAVTGNGKLFTWGNFYYGHNYDISKIASDAPQKTMEGVIDVEFSNFRNLRSVITDDGELLMWGDEFSNYIGNELSPYREGIGYPARVHMPDRDNNLIIIDNVVVDGHNCTGDVVIPEGVTEIADEAFINQSEISSVMIPDTVTRIGISAFENCDNLTCISIPGSVTSIGNEAFYDCDNLSSIEVPGSVVDIGYEAFGGTKWQEEIRKNNGFVIVNGILFDVYNCPENVVVPDNVRKIGKRAFEHYKDYEWDFQNRLSSTPLCSVTIPSSVTCIEEEAFKGCKNLSSVTIPDSVEKIGQDAFYGTPWQEARLKESPFIIVNGILIDGKNCSGNITIPEGVTRIGDYAFAGNNSSYNESPVITVTIPYGVTSIGNYAFQSCGNLSSITIPDSVTSIGDYAFENCSSLTNVFLPDSIKSIGKDPFLRCSNLAPVNIPTNIEHFDKNSFGPEWLRQEHVKSKDEPIVIIVNNRLIHVGSKVFRGAEEYEIPDTVTRIENFAFANMRYLSSLYIPLSVKEFGENIFMDCYNLRDIYYPGTEEQWNAIIKGKDNTRLHFITVHFNYSENIFKNSELVVKTVSDTFINSENVSISAQAPRLSDADITSPVSEVADDTGMLNVKFEGLIPDNVYNLYCMRSRVDEIPLSIQNLLYIGQYTADVNGEVRADFIPSDSDEEAEVFVVGMGEYVIAPEPISGEKYDPKETTPATTATEKPVTTTTTAAETKPATTTTTVATAKTTTTTKSVASKPATTASVITTKATATTTTMAATSATKKATTTVTELTTTITKAVSTTAVTPTTAVEGSATDTTVTTDRGQETQTTSIGDLNSDGVVDSSDASEILMIYAQVSTGGGDVPEETKAVADINGDGLVDSSDASLILEYYAYVSTGGSDSAEEYFAKTA